jgi:hypothetical protein
MRTTITILYLLLSTCAFSQLKFPKEFKLIKGDNGTGADDIYTNGKYYFDCHNLFNGGSDFDYKNNDNATKNYIADFFGFPFHITKDSLYWGSGKYQNYYSYVVVTEGEVLELYSKYNDSRFSYYSTWLLSAVRKDRHNAFFPMRGVN